MARWRKHDQAGSLLWEWLSADSLRWVELSGGRRQVSAHHDLALSTMCPHPLLWQSSFRCNLDNGNVDDENDYNAHDILHVLCDKIKSLIIIIMKFEAILIHPTIPMGSEAKSFWKSSWKFPDSTQAAYPPIPLYTSASNILVLVSINILGMLPTHHPIIHILLSQLALNPLQSSWGSRLKSRPAHHPEENTSNMTYGLLYEARWFLLWCHIASEIPGLTNTVMGRRCGTCPWN